MKRDNFISNVPKINWLMKTCQNCLFFSGLIEIPIVPEPWDEAGES